MVNIVSVIEDNTYLLWQQEVQALNLKEFGLPLWVVIVSKKPLMSERAKRLTELCNVLHVYEPDLDKAYPPANKPYGLAKLLDKHPELSENLFLLDSDVIFRELPDFSKFTDDKGLYMSDCNSYLNYDYVTSKYNDDDALKRLLGIAGIDGQKLLEMNRVSGGAQYFFRHITAQFCREVYEVSLQLYSELKAAKDQGKNDIQIWTAEMWAWIWCGTKYFSLYVTDELSFCWATDPIERWEKTKMLHMAGVTSRSLGIFYKGLYTAVAPWESSDFDYITKDNTCAWVYLEKMFGYKGRKLPDLGKTEKKKPRAIAVYLENSPKLINQFWGLYNSFKYSGLEVNTDLVVFCDDMSIKLPADVKVYPYKSISRSGPFKGYHFINSVSCIADSGDILRGYDYVLKTDLDTFVTPRLLDFFPTVFHTGIGKYSHLDAPEKTRAFAKRKYFKHKGIHNIGATWYGAGSLVVKVAQDTVKLCKDLLQEETFGEWPGWYRGVVSMYASEIAINHNVERFVISGLFDSESTSESNIDSVMHIHCWHTEKLFSKFAYERGEYVDINPNSLDKTVVNQYCLGMMINGATH